MNKWNLQFLAIALTLLINFGCSSKTIEPTAEPVVPTPATPATAEAPAKTPEPTAATSESSAPLVQEKTGAVSHHGEELKIELKDKNGKAVTPAPQSHSAHHEVSDSVPAMKSLGWLKNGNSRFLKKNLRSDGQSQTDIQRLSHGQKPHAIVLSCADSRVPPEIVFDQKLGEIFVVRAAGQALDSSTIASIEYAVAHLGSKLILVMGHTQCGAVKAALSTLNGEDAGSEWLNKLVGDIHPRVMEFKNTTNSKNYQAEGWANTKGVAKDLLQRSKIISEAANSGELKIISSLYDLDSGKVDFE